MSLDSLIRDAITNRRVLKFHYDGVTRECHPHVYGESQGGTAHLRAWQTKGRIGSQQEWRDYILNKIFDASTTGSHFQPQQFGFSGTRRDMHRVYLQI